MNPRYPIYIISKGRHESRVTARVLYGLGVPFSIVVEPQEAEAYSAALRPMGDACRVLVLPFSNLGEGSIPARNWVWEHAIAAGARRHWILDDNIGVFRRLYKNTIYPVGDGTMFRVLEDIVDRYDNVPMAGLNYQNFVPKRSAMPPLYLNTRVYSMILLSSAPTIRWRGRYNEDTDLSLRFLKQGDCTIGDKAGTQTMKGGNTEEVYEGTDQRREFAESLKEQHPDVVNVIWKWGRWHHQVDYRRFRSNRLKLRPGVVVPEGVDNYGLRLQDRRR